MFKYGLPPVEWYETGGSGAWRALLSQTFVKGKLMKVSSPESPTPTVVGEGCVGQKRPVPANGPAGTDHPIWL